MTCVIENKTLDELRVGDGASIERSLHRRDLHLWAAACLVALALANPAVAMAQAASGSASCDDRYQELKQQLAEVETEFDSPEAVAEHLDDAYRRCTEGNGDALEEFAEDERYEMIFYPAGGN